MTASGSKPSTGADYLSAAAFDDQPPVLIADVPLPVVEPDILVIKPNGHLPDLSGRLVWLWPAQDDDSRGRMAQLASELLSRPSAEACLIVDAPPPVTLAEAIDGLSNAKTVSFHAPPAKRKDATISPETASAHILWEQLGLARNERGPYATEANALRILNATTHYEGRIWLDDFAQRLMITDEDGTERLFTKTDALQCLAWMQEALKLPKMSLTHVTHAAMLVGERNKQHRIKDWLSALQWDRIERLPSLLSDGWGATQSTYTSAVGRCWLIGMVARIMEPGQKMDTLPVFEGRQGILKSTSLQTLVPEKKYFLSSNIDPIRNQKDFLQSLQGKWLVEFAEINRYVAKESHADDMKALISIESDTYRVPYGASTMDYPRQCVFSGTCNTQEWIIDQTGGRRFWPIECGEINLEFIASNRDQLFAEALHRYRMGEPWWDVPYKHAMDEQESRRIKDEWEGLIERYIHEGVSRVNPGPAQWYDRPKPLEYLTVMDLLTNCMGIPEGRCDRSVQMRVAQCLRTLGFVKFRPNENGLRFNAYKRDPKADV